MSIHFYKLDRSLPRVCFSRRLRPSISCYPQEPLSVKLWTKSCVSLGWKILNKHATLVCPALLGWLWINTRVIYVSSLALICYLAYAFSPLVWWCVFSLVRDVYLSKMSSCLFNGNTDPTAIIHLTLIFIIIIMFTSSLSLQLHINFIIM